MSILDVHVFEPVGDEFPNTCKVCACFRKSANHIPEPTKCREESNLMSYGCDLIAAERERQLAVEKWTAEHDDQHENGELALAAVAYASPLPVKVRAWVQQPCGCRSAGECTHHWDGLEQWVDPWPWDSSYDKRSTTDRVRSLVKAGALIAAEIDRQQRKPPR